MPTAVRAPRLSQADRRESILDAAVPLFMEHGSGVTTRQIADAAGIAEGTIFRVFADKDALVDAVVERFMDPLPTQARLAAIDADQGLEDTVTAIVEILKERIRGVIGIMHAVGMRTPPAPPSRGSRDDAQGVAAAILARHRAELSVEPDAAVAIIRAAVFGSTVVPFAGASTLEARELASLIVHGIGKG